MRFSMVLTVLAGVCLSSVATVASAQDLPQPLSLAQALERAAQYNPTLRSASLDVRRQEGAYEHANVPVPSNPQVSLQSYEEVALDGSVSTDIGVTLSQELWVAGQAGLRENAAGARLEAARARLDFLSSSIAARTREAFLRTLVAQRAVETARDVLQANRDLHDFALRRLEAGEANRLEVNAARIGLGRAEALVAGAENDLRQSRLALAQLLWVDPARELSLSGEIAPVELDIPDQRTLLNRAVQRRGDLAAAAEQVAAAQEDLKLARRQLIPNLTVFAVSNADINKGSGPLAGLSFELPLLHRYGGERKQAVARLASARLEQDTRRLAVRNEVLEALSAYRSGREQLEALSDEVLAAAQDNFQLAMQAFEAGEVDAPALTSTQTDLINIRREYLQALNNLVAAGTRLERATGGLLTMSNADDAASEDNR